MCQPRPRNAVPGTSAPGAREAARRHPGIGAVALVSVVLGALLAVVVVLSGTTAASAAGSCSGPIANGQIRVVIVVDPGDTGPRGPMATCLVVNAGTSGSQILAQRASQLGLPSPRYAGSGLLCGLDGFPATACPANNGGAYDYWAYFNGRGGAWSYGHDNPFVRRMVDGEIMGWRYTTGSADGDAPMPRLAPSSSLFPPLTPATTSPPPPAVPSLPPSGGGAAGGSGSASGGGAFVPVDPATSTPAGGRRRDDRHGRGGAAAGRSVDHRGRSAGLTVPMRTPARSWRRHP